MRRYVQISAGRGPVECARAVTLVAEELKKTFPELVCVHREEHNTMANCCMSITFSMDTNEGAWARIEREWAGTILYRAKSNSFRPGYGRRNWFVRLTVFDEVELPTIKEKDIRYESCRSWGKGGQNVNKVETSIRAIHIPTGLAVRCDDERSQTQNKVLARERLLLNLHEQSQKLESEAQKSAWRLHTNIERGNPVKIFTGKL